ncbi:hypothetical protein [Patulibacter minatonensis]|uniref:hypothetical protein n=1 Tax=Patulibacter minatonensis TaxID=298163 RepID=UPI0004790F85|nr:hypothetical protein [Patulibacter minatonensis]
MATDPLDQALTTPGWFTHPIGSLERTLIVDLERIQMPWRWQRAEYPMADGSTAIYGVLLAEVGYVGNASPNGTAPIHSRADVKYAFGLYLEAHRQARGVSEPVQLELFEAAA